MVADAGGEWHHSAVNRVAGARWITFVWATAAAAAFLACSARSVPPIRHVSSVGARRAEVEGLILRGSATCLRQARDMALTLHREAPESADVRHSLVRAELLLALRERQLGVPGDRSLTAARDLLAACPDCNELRVFLEVVEAHPPAGGLSDPGGADALQRYRWLAERRGRWIEVLGPRATTDPVAAAFFLALPPDKEPDVREVVIHAHAGSPLVLFAAALGEQGAQAAERVLSVEPTFQEARLVLAREAGAARRPGSAEEHLRKVLEVALDSVAARLELGDILDSLGEITEALEVYEGIFDLVPGHSEAQLRAGILLSRLNRPQEAISRLGPLLEGHLNLGEAHYWTAWNQDQPGQREAAGHHIEAAMHYLPDDPRVYELAGRLAMAEEAVGLARTRFTKVVELAAAWPGRYDGSGALCHSLYFLGQIASRERDWATAERHFESAAACEAAAERGFEEQGRAIRGWSLAAARQEALTAANERQREGAGLRRAGGLYNAAACALNRGRKDAAAGLATQAAAHPAYKDKAEALLAKARQ